MNTKRCFLILVVLATIVPSVPTYAQSKAANHILKLTKEYSEAIARRDASVHERLFAHDYSYTHDKGNFMGREEHINFTKKGKVVVDSLRNVDLLVRMYRKTAVVTGLWIITLRMRGNEPEKIKLRYILVYVKRGGQWQIVAEQRSSEL